VRFLSATRIDRKIGDEEQHSKLRPKRIGSVILRHKQYEVPFSRRAAEVG